MRQRVSEEIERLANRAWPGEVGQVIVRRIVSLFHIESGEPLMVIDHGTRSQLAALAALRVLADEACAHFWVELCRDTGDQEHAPTLHERCTLCSEERSRSAMTLSELLQQPDGEESEP